MQVMLIGGAMVGAGGMHAQSAAAKPAEALTVATQSSTPLRHWHHTTWPFDAAAFTVPAPNTLRSADGYLWIGADDKLLRFDGVRFFVFDSMNTPVLRNRDASRLVPEFSDAKGNLWIRGQRRALLTYRNGTFALATSPDVGPNSRLRTYLSASVARDGRGQIWWADRELVMIDEGHSRRPSLPVGVPDTGVLAVARDTGTGMWLGTATQGMWHVSESGVEHFPFPDDNIMPVVQTSDGVLWATSRGRKLQVWRLVNGRWEGVHPTRDVSQPVSLQSILEAPDHSVFLATRGLGVLRWQNGTIEQFDESNGLSSNNTSALYIAPDGTVWVATESGLDRLRQSEFISLDRRAGLPFGAAFQFTPDVDGGLWATTPGTGNLYFVDGGPVRSSNSAVSARAYMPTNGDQFQILERARGGGVWIGPNIGGLIRQRREDKYVVPASAQLPKARFISGLESKDGAVWLDAFGGEFGRIRNGAYKRVALFERELAKVRGMLEDSRGQVWAVGEQTNLVSVLAGDSVVATLTLPRSVGFGGWIAREGVDTMWVSTDRSLVRIIGSELREVRVRDIARYLATAPHIEVGAGHLWIASRGGILRVPLADLHSAIEHDGEASPPVPVSALDGIAKPFATTRIPHAGALSPDGRIWFATPGGYAITNPAYSVNSLVQPEPHVEEVLVDGRTVSSDSALVIPPRPDRVAVHYTATSLSVPERVHIEYMLEGADRTWTNGSVAPRVATYTQLRPGSYSFRVRAWNMDGPRRTAQTVLHFRVARAWYQAYWFMAVCVLLLGTLCFVIALAVQRERSKRLTERTEARFKAVLDERSRIARELHDTLLQGFTGITLHLETVRAQLAQRADASAEELATILQHADGTLREAREMVWDIRSPALGNRLIHAIEAESRKILNGDNVQLQLSVTGSERRLQPMTETTILRVAREAVTNALKHADPKSIAVTLAYDTHRVALIVVDDGRGIEPSRIEQARSRGHWGLAGMRERAARADGTFDIQSAPDTGTSIAMTLPAEPIE